MGLSKVLAFRDSDGNCIYMSFDSCFYAKPLTTTFNGRDCQRATKDGEDLWFVSNGYHDAWVTDSVFGYLHDKILGAK